MCVVSMVTDHYFQKYPQPSLFPWYSYPDLEELIRKAKLYDEMTNQPDCPDPLKQDWLKQVQEKFAGRGSVLTSS